MSVRVFEVGEKYNWVNQSERLIYLGKSGHWYQFALVDKPDEVWCEVSHDLLGSIVKTEVGV